MFKLIVVDDEKLIQESVSNFEWNEIDVVPAGCFDNGKDALEYMESNPVDIILLDIGVSGKDGIEFLQQFRNTSKDVAVICISECLKYEYLRTCMRAGVKDYILKPIDKEDLFESVQMVLLEKAKISKDDTDSLEQQNYHHYIEKAKRYIEKNYAQSISLENVAEYVFLNPVYLSSLFKKVTGVRFSEYLTECRIQKAKELLRQTTLRIGKIAELVGYKESRYFSEIFKKNTGMTPNEYRNQKIMGGNSTC